MALSIELASPINVTVGNFTVDAGVQGITTRNHEIVLTGANNTVWDNFRGRRGDTAIGPHGTGDTFSINSTSNVLMENFSLAFGMDGVLDITKSSSLIFKYGIISDGLLNPVNYPEENHGFAGLWQDVDTAIIWRCLIINCSGRPFNFDRCRNIAFINNIIVNTTNDTPSIYASGQGTPLFGPPYTIDMLGNWIIQGPDTNSSGGIWKNFAQITDDNGISIYASDDNRCFNRPLGTEPITDGIFGTDYTLRETALDDYSSEYPVISPYLNDGADLIADIIANCGANLPDGLDATDTRVMTQLQSAVDETWNVEDTWYVSDIPEGE